MPQIVYNGYVTINAFSTGETFDALGEGEWGVKNIDNYGQVSLFNRTIQWNGSVPAYLSGKTIYDLRSSDEFIVSLGDGTISYSADVTNNLGSTYFTLTICGRDYSKAISAGDFVVSNEYVDLTCNPQRIGYELYNTDINYDLHLMSAMRWVLPVTVTVNCTGPNLQSNVCRTVCSSGNTDCVDDMIDHCLSAGSPNEFVYIVGTGEQVPNPEYNPNWPRLRIFDNTVCYNYFNTYYGNGNVNTEIDNILVNYCVEEYENIATIQNGGLLIREKNLCACNMRDSQYENLRDSLDDQFPGLGSLVGNSRCLFTPCVNSAFKTAGMGGVCTTPACLNIASIENDGSIGGDVTVEQNAECASFDEVVNGDGDGDGSEPPAEQSWFSRNLIYIIIGAILLLAIIIIIIVIIVVASRNANSNEVSVERRVKTSQRVV